jgi:hypothetical protein
MSLIDERGFLGEHMVGWILKIRSNHSDFFDLAADMNKLSQKVLFDLKANSRNPHEIIMESLFIRCLNTFQGLVLLAERGMMAQSRILARALMEALFRLCALSKKPEPFDVFIKEDKKSRLMFLYTFRKFHGGKLPDNVKGF